MRIFYLIFFLSQVLADPSQELMVTLGSYHELSSLVTQIKSFPQLLQQLRNADNFTLIAPTNVALETWLSGNRSRDLIENTLTYHLLNGTYATASLNDYPVIISTALTNTSYVNITGGQRVKAFNSGQVEISSKANITSKVLIPDIPTLGGLIHVVDTVLEIPDGIVAALPSANLSYVIEILTKGNYFNIGNSGFSDSIATSPDLAIFMANSAAAVAHFNTTGKTQSEINNQIEYHILDQLTYSTDFSNGTELMTRAGLPLFVTISDNGSVYINMAKITSFDCFIATGVYHVLDDILDPNYISRPNLPITNQSLPDASGQSPSYATSSNLTTGEEIGIGAGTGVVVIALLVVFALRCCHRRASTPILDNTRKQEWSELSTGISYETPQLETGERAIELSETKEHAVELPASDYYEIGRAF